MPRRQSSNAMFFLPFMLFLGIFLAVMIWQIFDTGPMPFAILAGVLLVIEGVLMLFLIKSIKKGAQMKRIAQSGTQAQATYISHSSNLQINHVSYFRVEYSFVNDRGETVNARTPSLYLRGEAEHLRRLGTFQIRHDNQNSTIVEDFNNLQLNRSGNFTNGFQPQADPQLVLLMKEKIDATTNMQELESLVATIAQNVDDATFDKVIVFANIKKDQLTKF